MTRRLPRLSFLAAALLLAAPAAADNPPPAACPPAADALTTQDQQVLATAEQLAHDASQAIEQWLVAQAVTEEQLFARLYYPMPKTTPRKFTTVYDALADRDLVAIEDKALAASPQQIYAIVTDINGYVPAHNTRFTRPLTGDDAKDAVGNRTKRLLNDPQSFAAARSTARYLLQKVRGDDGEPHYDLSVPLTIRGKHWGTARIGFRRAP